MQPVLSGSMTGYADRGDLVVGVRTDARSLHVGDVILFAPPAPYGTPGGHPVAHRIFDLRTVDGKPVAMTKGDANSHPDPWNLDLTRTRTAEVRLVLPDAGWPFIRLRLLTTPAGRMTSGLGLMTVGGLILLVGRKRRPRRSDEPWPPPFEDGPAEVAPAEQTPAEQTPAQATPPATVGGLAYIPRQSRRPLDDVVPWSAEEALAHAPID